MSEVTITPDAASRPRSRVQGICVGRLATGQTVRRETTSAGEVLETIDPCQIAWVNFGVADLYPDAEAIATVLGFSPGIIDVLRQGRYSGYEDRDTELGLLLPVVRVVGLEVRVYHLIVLCRRGLIVTIHEGDSVTRFHRFARYADTYLRKLKPDLPQQDMLTHVLIRIVNENNDRNFDGLRQIEEHGGRVSEMLVDKGTPRENVAPEIHRMKIALILYLDTLWATLDVLQNLRHGDAELMSDDETLLARVGILVDDVNRHIQLSEHMSEVLASGLEVLQSVYNNQLQALNNRLAYLTAYLTVLGTALLVPNTLATVAAVGVYEVGPDDRAWFTAFILASTILSALGAYWFVKRRGWLPSVDE